MKKILFILLVAVFMFTSCPHKSVTINNYTTTTTTGSGDTTPSEPTPVVPTPEPEPEVLIPSVEKVLYFKQKLTDNSIAERVYIFGENLKVLSEDDVYATNGGMLENFTKANLKGKIIIYFDYKDGPFVSERGNTDTIVVNKESLNVYNEFTIKFNNFIVNVGDSVVLTGIDGELPTEVVIPEGVEAIADNLFTGNTDIVSVDMSDSEITHIGANAFNGCTSISSIQFPTTLVELEMNSLKDCDELTELDFRGTSLRRIKFDGLGGCDKLETVYFPDTLKVIHPSVFYNDNYNGRKLKNIYLDTTEGWYKYKGENIEVDPVTFDVTLKDGSEPTSIASSHLESSTLANLVSSYASSDALVEYYIYR